MITTPTHTRNRCLRINRNAEPWVLTSYVGSTGLALFLSQRTLASFRDFGVLPAFTGVAVSDRYVNYFHPGWEHLAGHQATMSANNATASYGSLSVL